jgi:signal transduction histidine kinase
MRTLRVIWERLREIDSANPDLIYTALAVALTIGAVATIPDSGPGGGFTAAIAFLRRWPLYVFTVFVGALITEAALGYELGDVAFLSGLVTVFIVASRTTGVRAALGAGLTAGVLIALFFLEGGGVQDFGDLLVSAAIFAAAWTGGVLVRLRVARVAQVESYAAELSVQRDVAAQEAAADERARIARELHDAVGHTLNLIVVQAGAAQRVRESNPAAAYDALKSIENTGRQALTDMDRMLAFCGSSRRRPAVRSLARAPAWPGSTRCWTRRGLPASMLGWK